MSRSLSQFRSQIGFSQDETFSEKFPLQGGLNTDSPDITSEPGNARELLNYEPSFDVGYKSKGGFEAWDGHPQPSAYLYQYLTVQLGASYTLPAIGTPLSNQTSLSTQWVLDVLGVPAPNAIITIVTSQYIPTLVTAETTRLPPSPYTLNFAIGDTLSTLGPATVGTLLGFGGVASEPQNTTYINAAQTAARNRITPIGGAACSGAALGVADFAGSTFGFRNNVGATAALCFVATQQNGWVAVPLGFILFFQSGTDLNRNPGGDAILEGDTLTGGTSGATCVVTRVVPMFGSYTTGDCKGYVITRTITGTFVANETLKVGTSIVAATPSSGIVSQANSLPPGGSYRFRRWNFDGVKNHYRLYGVNGVGPAFEIDLPSGIPGVTGVAIFTPILTGMGLTTTTWNSFSSQETPTRIMVHNDHMFLCYPGGSLQHSGYQTPRNWQVIVGADERMTGDDIIAMQEQPNNTSFIASRKSCWMLYGDMSENFQLRRTAYYGIAPDTAVPINGLSFLTDEGVTFQYSSDQFGNFASGCISARVDTRLKQLMRTGKGVIEGTLSRDRSVYRLLFDGGLCLSFCIVAQEYTVSQGAKGIGLVDYGITMSNVFSDITTIVGGNNPPLREHIWMCGADGNVYLDDVGTTFNGQPINTYMELCYYPGQQNLNRVKQYKRVYIDALSQDSAATFMVGAGYDDSGGFRTDEVYESIMTGVAGIVIDVSSFDNAYWDATGFPRVHKELHGRGTSCSIRVKTSSTIFNPHNLQAVELVQDVRARRSWR